MASLLFQFQSAREYNASARPLHAHQFLGLEKADSLFRMYNVTTREIIGQRSTTFMHTVQHTDTRHFGSQPRLLP